MKYAVNYDEMKSVLTINFSWSDAISLETLGNYNYLDFHKSHRISLNNAEYGCGQHIALFRLSLLT